MEIILAAGILDDLGINLKVWAVQIGVFVVTFVILSRLLFGRILSHLQKREEEIRRQGEGIAREREEIARLTQEYDAHIAQVEKEAYDRMQIVLKEGLAEGHRIIGRAQDQAHQQIENARLKLAEERARASEQLQKEVVKLTTNACSRILNMPIDPAQVEPEVQRILAEGK